MLNQRLFAIVLLEQLIRFWLVIKRRAFSRGARRYLSLIAPFAGSCLLMGTSSLIAMEQWTGSKVLLVVECSAIIKEQSSSPMQVALVCALFLLQSYGLSLLVFGLLGLMASRICGLKLESDSLIVVQLLRDGCPTHHPCYAVVQ